ncbi:MAG: hypothetical protein RIC12_01765 [Pirellulales bacterium]
MHYETRLLRIALYGLISLASCARLLNASAVADEMPQPFIRLSESEGHLKFSTCIPPGKMNVSAFDQHGIFLKGFVLAAGQGEQKHVKLFRLQGELQLSDPAKNGSFSPTNPHEFSVALRATTNPHHYTLAVQVARSLNGETVVDQARLGRNCCGYFVSATQNGVALPPGRATRLSELMVNSAETYQQFEQLTQQCCRPGFEFVPVSLLSPSVVAEVVSFDGSRPTAEAAARFQFLLAELDADEFARRENATGELIRGGRSTLWFLEGVETEELSAEQGYRIRLILSKL